MLNSNLNQKENVHDSNIIKNNHPAEKDTTMNIT